MILEEYFDRDRVKAIVYLLAEGDDRNRALISDEHLLVIRKNKKSLFRLQDIAKLTTGHKKMLFPLFLGGIMTPFGFLSYFTNFFHPVLHLLMILSSMFLFYLGWAGRDTLTILLKDGEEILVYLPGISKNLRAFMNYVNNFLANRSAGATGELLFFQIKKDEIPWLTGDISKEGFFPIYGYTYDQLKRSTHDIDIENIMAIRPHEAGREIKFDFDPANNELRPRLDGPVLKASLADKSEYMYIFTL